MRRLILPALVCVLTGPVWCTAATQPQPTPLPPPADVAAPPGDATVTPSGLAHKVLEHGTGKVHPDPWDRVTVHYTGWTTDGTMFDSSLTRGAPSTFSLQRVIPGWTEALQLMVVGEKRRLWVPESLAYGGQPGQPQGMLVFDIELFHIIDQPPPLPPEPAPTDVAAPPEDAVVTESGLAYKVLRPGHGERHPEADSTVAVEYTGWTTDGTMFDSSADSVTSPRFPLDRVIPGFSEGLRLMVEGQRNRLWIPEDLAYAGRPGAPKGMLVFDVELVRILDRPEPPQLPAPDDVTAPPEDAIVTESGLAYKVLQAGSGERRPGPRDRVQVLFAGWTTDGRMFDSSAAAEQPPVFLLSQTVRGVSEGLQLMVEGQKSRLWVPEELAYRGAPGAPPGMLVFDIELVRILGN